MNNKANDVGMNLLVLKRCVCCGDMFQEEFEHQLFCGDYCREQVFGVGVADDGCRAH